MSVGSFLKKLVPYLSTAAEAFGGPAGAIAATILTKVTGSTVAAPDLGKVISNLSTSEQGRIQLDAAEKEYAETMAKLGYDSVDKLSQTLEDDRASARAREVAVRDSTPRVFAYCILGGTVAVATLIISGRAPGAHDPTEATLIGTVVGYMFRDLASVIAYYFGGGSDNGNGNGNSH